VQIKVSLAKECRGMQVTAGNNTLLQQTEYQYKEAQKNKNEMERTNEVQNTAVSLFPCRP